MTWKKRPANEFACPFCAIQFRILTWNWSCYACAGVFLSYECVSIEHAIQVSYFHLRRFFIFRRAFRARHFVSYATDSLTWRWLIAGALVYKCAIRIISQFHACTRACELICINFRSVLMFMSRTHGSNGNINRNELRDWHFEYKFTSYAVQPMSFLF